jgi:hypothetical protein
MGAAAAMSGGDIHQDSIFISCPRNLGTLRPSAETAAQMVNQALREFSPDFQAMYSSEGRPSIPPEKLLRALLLQVRYTIRSDLLLMEQLDYNLFFR